MLWVGQKASTGAASPSTSAVLLCEFQALKKKKKNFWNESRNKRFKIVCEGIRWKAVLQLN